MNDYERSPDGKVVYVRRFREQKRRRELSDEARKRPSRGRTLEDMSIEQDFFTPSRSPKWLGYGLLTIAVISGAGLVYWIYS